MFEVKKVGNSFSGSVHFFEVLTSSKWEPFPDDDDDFDDFGGESDGIGYGED